ncbi:hypothetical protein HDE_08573 [Halotydeus destructor]|nr:hypothetical protein HDE_08573 [Halotydeus destructor]
MKKLVERLSSSHKASYEDQKALSRLLLSEYRTKLIDYIMESITKFFSPEPEARDEGPSRNTRGQYVMFQDIQCLVRFLTHFCVNWSWEIVNEFRSEQFEKKLRIVLIFKAIFAASTEVSGLKNFALDINLNHNGVWKAFLEQFRDTNARIRVLCTQAAQYLMQSHVADLVVTDIQEALERRLRDLDVSVREEAIRTIGNIGQDCVPNICLPKLMKTFASRCGDIDPNVRHQAIQSVGQVFAHMVKINNPQIVKLNHVFKMASACLLMYKGSQCEQEKAAIEGVFERDLVDAISDNVTAKAMNILNLICYCVDKAVASIAQIMFNQSQMRTRLLAIVGLVASGQGSFRAFARHVKALSPFFPQLLNSTNVLRNIFIDLKDDRTLLAQLTELFAPCRSLDYASAIHVATQFTRALANESPSSNLNESDLDTGELLIRELIIQRCSPFIIDCDIVTEIVDRAKHFDPIYNVRIASFLVLLAKLYGAFFERKCVIEKVYQLPVAILRVLSDENILPLLNMPEGVIAVIKNLAEGCASKVPNSVPEIETEPEMDSMGLYVSRHFLAGYLQFLT